MARVNNPALLFTQGKGAGMKPRLLDSHGRRGTRWKARLCIYRSCDREVAGWHSPARQPKPSCPRPYGRSYGKQGPTGATSVAVSARSSLGRRIRFGWAALSVGMALAQACQSLHAAESDRTDFAAVMAQLGSLVQGEVAAGHISGVTVALVEDQRTLFVKGFGFANKARRVPAAPDTVYRCGSISKLFTALATMQLAEQGRLDIDKPITNYAPDCRIVIPFEDAKPITLRQLMCHRSGFIRESPVGGYFDDAQAGLDKTVASIASCVLVYPPGTKTKYSNIGVAVEGWIAAKVAGLPFERYQEEHLLGPIGMTSSAFRLERRLKPRLARAYMMVAQENGEYREIEAPQFELGTIPAGNLYTTAEDLARFLSFLFAQGRAGGRQLLKPETIAEMFKPQLTAEATGFGLGFFVGNFRDQKVVRHTGAVYGFTSSIAGLPGTKLGVVVLCNDDIATGPVQKIGNQALALLLGAKTGKKPAPKPPPLKMAAADLASFAGEYESESYWGRLEVAGEELRANISGQRMTLRPVEPLRFEAHGRVAHESPFTFERDAKGRVTGFTALSQKFRRVDPRAAREIPEEWRKFLGSYGPAFIPLIISVKHGHLYAMTENEFDYRLTPLNRYVFKMPPGLYTDEQLVFQVGKDGKAHSAVLANMTLPRRKR
jgi:serine beta-lactamase-like protein LACTB